MQDGVGQLVPEGVADLGGLEGAAGAVAALGDLDELAGKKHTAHLALVGHGVEHLHVVPLQPDLDLLRDQHGLTPR